MTDLYYPHAKEAVFALLERGGGWFKVDTTVSGNVETLSVRYKPNVRQGSGASLDWTVLQLLDFVVEHGGVFNFSPRSRCGSQLPEATVYFSSEIRK